MSNAKKTATAKTATTTTKRTRTKAATPKAQVLEVVQPSIEEILQPIKGTMSDMIKETTLNIQMNVAYILVMAEKAAFIAAHFDTIAKANKKGLIVATSDGLYQSDLTKSKTKGDILGKWDYLAYEGLTPVKYNQIAKLLRIWAQHEAFQGLSNDQVLSYGVNDMNTADKFAAHVKNTNSPESFLEEGEGREKKQPAEKRQQFVTFANRAQINSSFFLSRYHSAEQAKTALMNALILELGYVNFSETVKAAILEDAAQLAHMEEEAHS